MGSDIESTAPLLPLPIAVRAACENLPHGDLSKLPSQIPKQWKTCATAFFCDSQFYKAITRILWRFQKSDEVMKKLVDHPMPTHFTEVKKTTSETQWAKNSDELPPDKWGMYQVPCKGGTKAAACFRINPTVYGPEGNAHEIKNSDATVRQTAISHEGIHKLLHFLGLDAAHNHTKHPLLDGKEEIIVTRAMALYVQNSPDTNPLPAGIEGAFAACRRPNQCGRASAKSSKNTQGIFMGVPSLSVPNVSSRDFNNDGVPDEVSGGAFCTQDYIKPELLGPSYADYPIFHLDTDCQLNLTASKDHYWAITRPDYLLGTEDFHYDFLRFFNSTRSMSFAPGEQILIRGSTTPAMVESLVFLYNLERDQMENTEEPVRFALLSGCQLVGLDEIVNVTTSGVRLDMERAKGLAGLARSREKTLTPPTSAETEMASMLKSAARRMADKRRTGGKEVGCKELVSSLSSASLTTQLPEGWERSFCFTLGVSPYGPSAHGPGGIEAPQGAGVTQ